MGRRSISWAWARRLSVAAVAAATLGVLSPGTALAEVRREGDWSDDDPEVTLDFDNLPRAEAVKRLASAAGWSVVLSGGPQTGGPPGSGLISLHVKDQPAGKLLDIVLADGRYVARRDDRLIAIAPDDGPRAALPGLTPPAPMGGTPIPPVPMVPSVPPVPPVPPLPPQTDMGHDRFVTGGNLRIEAGEVVHDVTVMGGNLDVWGTVTGDLSVMGGNVRLHRDARVRGDAAAVGGNLTLDSGAAVDGDVGVVGGVVHREEGCRIGGEIHEGMRKAARHHNRSHTARASAGGAGAAAAPAKAPEASRVQRLLRDAADAINAAALLFVFGAVLLALVPERMERLKVQIASRPMRSFATGVVGVIPVLFAAVLLCLPVITIPFVVAALLGAVLAGTCSVLETVGGALLAHRTKNPYVHLALGGVIFLVAGALPVIGGPVKLVVLFTALGSVVATRGAGLIPERRPKGSPYRTTGAFTDA